MKSDRWCNRNRILTYLRFGTVGTFVSAAVALGLSGISLRSVHPNRESTELGKVSAAFARHVEDAFADNIGPAGESPTSWADENYQLNGGDQITADQIAGASAAFSTIQKKGVGNDKKSTASWFSLGPTNAIYPAFLNRHHSEYVASGRITALAIAPNCTTNACTLWVGAAGGGIWRTDKALGGANWVNVSDGFFASGAIGALTY